MVRKTITLKEIEAAFGSNFLCFAYFTFYTADFAQRIIHKFRVSRHNGVVHNNSNFFAALGANEIPFYSYRHQYLLLFRICILTFFRVAVTI